MRSSSRKTLGDEPQHFAEGDHFRKSICCVMIFYLFHSYSGEFNLPCHEQLGEFLRRQNTLGNISFEQPEYESSHLNEVTVSFCPLISSFYRQNLNI